LDRFSRSFHQMKGICMIFSIRTSFFIPLWALPWQSILGKICEMTFIQHAGILQQIRISQFRFTDVKERNFCFILCIFGDDRSTNPRDYTGSFCTFWDIRQKSTYHTKYLSEYWTKLRQLFSIGRLVYADYKTEIIFAVVDETLLW